MIPILFERTEKDFLSNGICRLVDCLSCTVTEERNGIYECEFSYPVTGLNYDKITIGRIIYATHDDTQTPQPFDIYKRTANIDGIVTFYARHIAYRLANVILKPFKANSCAEAVAGLETNTINTNPFTFWTDKQVTANFSLLTPRSVWSTLGGQEGSILDVYGKGTYEFDKWTVRLYLNRGRQTDVQLRYGKDLTDFEHSEETGGVNAYVPFWRSSEGDTVVTVPGWVVIAAGQGGAEYLTTEDAEIIADENGVPIEVRPGTGAVPDILDLSDQFEEEPTPEQLQAEALRRLDQGKPWEPGENLRIDFAALWQSPEYEDVASLQRVGLCDTVSVFFPALGYTARDVQIIKTTYNTLLDRYDNMELGQPSVTLASLIKRDVEQTILRQVPSSSAMAQAIDEATKLITGGTGGHVVIATDADGKPNEILIMDTEDTATAVKVLRINQNGIGFSQNGYNGPFKTAWTLDGGFVADFITSGTLTANLIKAGVLTDKNENTVFDLESGQMMTKRFVLDAENIKITEDGRLELYDAGILGTRERTVLISGAGIKVITTGLTTHKCIIDLIPELFGGMSISEDGDGTPGVWLRTKDVSVFDKIQKSAIFPTGPYTSLLSDGLMYVANNIIAGTERFQFTNGAWSLKNLNFTGSLTKKGNELIKVQAVTFNISVSGNSSAWGTSVAALSGYTPVGILGFNFLDTNSSHMFLFRVYTDSTNVCWNARNTGSADYSGRLRVYVMYTAN